MICGAEVEVASGVVLSGDESDNYFCRSYRTRDWYRSIDQLLAGENPEFFIHTEYRS